MAERRVKLKSSDDEMFEVEESVAFESQAVKNMIEDTGMDHPIPLPNVSSKILAKVIQYCKYHVDNQKASDDNLATPEDEIKAWDLDFVKVDQATLFDLILAEVLESSSGTVRSDLLLERRRSVSIVPGLDKLYAAPLRCMWS
ncbi:unnamed protein product, partial [Sphagnum compactum]